MIIYHRSVNAILEIFGCRPRHMATTHAKLKRYMTPNLSPVDRSYRLIIVYAETIYCRKTVCNAIILHGPEWLIDCIYAAITLSNNTGIILGMGSANEKKRFIVKSPLIGWAHIQNDHCYTTSPFTCSKSLPGLGSTQLVYISPMTILSKRIKCY